MKRLKVFLHSDKNNETLIGELAEKNHRIYFQYDSTFLRDPLWLSPYKLPPEPGLTEFKDYDFGPLFGLFDDSLPDGWGLMLMDRFLRGQGVPVENLSVLDRLSFLGTNTMGALVYKPEMDIKTEENSLFDLYNLYVQSREISSGESRTVLADLIKAGGSPGGARPKVLAGVNGDKLIYGEGDLPEGYEHWIIKFNGNDDLIDSGAVEYAYSQMAGECRIEMTETRLFQTENGDRFFGIKRFDRNKNKRIHTHTFGNIIHSNFRIPSCDYSLFLRVTADLTKNHKDLLRAFRQMVFNIFANNRDDHVKNFSYIMNSNGDWFLSPAYDLTFSTGPGGEHSMTVDGEGKKPTHVDILRVGQKSGLNKIEILSIVDEVIDTVKKWPLIAEKAGVSPLSMESIESIIKRNIN